MDVFLQFYLPLFMAGFIILVFVWPSIRVYRQTGINPFRFATGHNEVHDYIGSVMKVFIALLVVIVLVYALFPAVYRNLGVFELLDIRALKWIGLALTHVSLAGILIAQNQMRTSWRIGIDYENRTVLITSGLFSVSRNPVFLFILLALVGLFLLLPNAIVFALLFAVYIVLQVTMRMEEAFLLMQHGIEYEIYKQQVRRLI